jgi:hypothetical protein
MDLQKKKAGGVEMCVLFHNVDKAFSLRVARFREGYPR